VGSDGVVVKGVGMDRKDRIVCGERVGRAGFGESVWFDGNRFSLSVGPERHGIDCLSGDWADLID
jgi:hypothetical protein